LKGAESIEGKDAWDLQVTQEGGTFNLCFDKIAGLMVRFDNDTGESGGNAGVFMGDYRRVGNVQCSYAATLYTTKVMGSDRLTAVEFSVPIDDALFLRASAGKGPS
jgi:hypothetical protein